MRKGRGQCFACSSDGTTIPRTENGLDDELLRLWQANESRLLALLASLTSRAEAADLLHETFVRVYQARPHQRRLPAQYLLRAAKNTAIDYLRSQYAIRAATAEYVTWLKTNRTPTQADADRRLLLREVRDAAAHLRATDQELLRLYVETPSIAAAARQLDLPYSTLASRFYAAIGRLRRELER